MEPKLLCQSCTMPIDNIADRGTEKNGSQSSEYCKYCYQNGAFTDKDMTLAKMKTIVSEQMEKMHLPKDVLQKSLAALPNLRRWRATQNI
jgi:predicted amidophosphoribosyltransferase